MYRIYFEKRILEICSHKDQSILDPNALIFYPGTPPDLGEAINIFDSNKDISKLCIPTDEQETCYKQLCSHFSQINAGGGLVRNKRGDCLFIYRNDLWDLPKGKQEAGEDIRKAALREVEEECGISNLDMQELICITDHTYKIGDKYMLKHTYWYNMTYDQPTTLIPQTEENISKAAWIAKSAVPKYLSNTYPSIIEVFKKARII